MTKEITETYHHAECQRTWAKRDPQRCKRCRQLVAKDGGLKVDEQSQSTPAAPTKGGGERKGEPGWGVRPPCTMCGHTPDRYLTADEAARYVGMSFFAFIRLVRAGVFPEYQLRVGGRHLRLDASHFDVRELDAWARAQVRTQGQPFSWDDNPRTMTLAKRMLGVDGRQKEVAVPLATALDIATEGRLGDAEENDEDVVDPPALARSVAVTAGLAWPLGVGR
jgi:hypothetical protein